MFSIILIVAAATSISGSVIPMVSRSLDPHKDNGMEYNISTKDPFCNFTVKPEDARRFVRLVMTNNANLAYFNLNISGNVSKKYRPDVFLPYIWIWTYNTTYGAYPYLRFHFDAGRLSFGLLDYYTLYSVKINLQSNPDNCLVDFGSNQTTMAIGQALANMTLTYYPPTIDRNSSVFCRINKKDNFINGKLRFYLATYLGLWEDNTYHECCSFARDQEDELTLTCSNRKKELSEWSSFFYLLGIIFFMYLPVPISYFCRQTGQSEVDIDRTIPRSPTNPDGYEDISAGIQNDRVMAKKESDDNWLYLGLDTPVTVLTALKSPLLSAKKNHPVLVSRLLRIFFFAILIPLPVFTKMIYYYNVGKFSTKMRLENNMTVGFLSIPYGFMTSFRNWLSIFGGPYVVFGFYFTVGMFLVSAPHDWCDFVVPFIIQRRNKRSCLPLSLTVTETFGSVKLRKIKAHEFYYRLFRGNMLTFLNPLFWKFKVNLARDRFYAKIDVSRHHILINVLLVTLYSLLCLLEFVVVLILLTCPTIYFLIHLTKAYIGKCNERYHSRLLSAFVFICIIFTAYGFFLLFIRSAIFVLLSLDYTYVGMIIYPNIGVGFVVGFGAMFLYMGGSSQKLQDSYLVILQHLVTISLEMAARKERIRDVRVRGGALILKKVDMREVESIKCGGLKISLTDSQRNILRQSHSILRQTDDSNEELVRWRGPHPGIPRALYLYAVDELRPLRGAVFFFLVQLLGFTVLVISLVALIQAFNRTSTFILSAQIITAIVLTVLPKVDELFTSHRQKHINNEILINRLRTTVTEYYEQTSTPGSKFSNQPRSIV